MSGFYKNELINNQINNLYLVRLYMDKKRSLASVKLCIHN